MKERLHHEPSRTTYEERREVIALLGEYGRILFSDSECVVGVALPCADGQRAAVSVMGRGMTVEAAIRQAASSVRRLAPPVAQRKEDVFDAIAKGSRTTMQIAAVLGLKQVTVQAYVRRLRLEGRVKLTGAIYGNGRPTDAWGVVDPQPASGQVAALRKAESCTV